MNQMMIDYLKTAVMNLEQSQNLAVSYRQGSTEFLVPFKSEAHRNTVIKQIEKLTQSIERLAASLKDE